MRRANNFLKSIAFLLLPIVASAQDFRIGVVCKNGRAEYSTKSGWKSFQTVVLPKGSTVKLFKGSKIQVFEIVNAKNEAALIDLGRSYCRNYQSTGDSAITQHSLALGFDQKNEDCTTPNEFIKVLLNDLFSGKSIANTQIGGVGGTRRGQHCPTPKMVSKEMESLFENHHISLSWLPSQDNTPYSLNFFADRQLHSSLWKTVTTSDSLIEINLPDSIFRTGEVYYWTIGTTPTEVCPANTFRILTSDELHEIESVWTDFQLKNSFESPLREVIRAEFLSLNGLFNSTELIYRQINLSEFPELLILKNKFDLRMKIR